MDVINPVPPEAGIVARPIYITEVNLCDVIIDKIVDIKICLCFYIVFGARQRVVFEKLEHFIVII
jgi:hypothetical protein